MRAARFGLTILATVFALATCAWAQTNSKQIMAQTPAQLVELLKNPKASIFEKAKACQQLAIVGNKDAISALVALLPDEKLNLYARYGLEGIPDPAVDVALRDAATKLHGAALVGAIDSIGQRRDAQAIGLLTGLLGSKDKGVAPAAAASLGKIGTPDSAKILAETLAKDPSNAAVADACVIGADRLATSGKKAEAVALCEAITKSNAPKNLKIAALTGQFYLQQAAAKDVVLAQIRNADKAYFNLGLAAARTIPGAELTAALVAELPKLSAERQAVLLRALGDRAPAAPMAVALAAAKSQSPAVREAAIYVLAKHGDASAAAVLLDAALGDAAVAQTAQDGLKAMRDATVDAAILARLAAADAKAKVVLFDVLSARRVTAAVPAIRAGLSDPNESVRLAAITALGRLAELNDIDTLAAKAFAEAAAAQTALKMAALRMSDPNACAAKLATRLTDATPANQTYILELLSKVGGKKALETVVALAKSNEPGTKDAATRVLGEWLSVDAAPVLLDIAKTDGDQKYQVRALRGYIRIARQLKLPAETKLGMFQAAIQAAKRDEERQLALEILTRIPSAATLNLAVAQLNNAALKEKAADTAVKIAAKVIVQDPKSVSGAMQQVVAAKATAPVDTRAKQLLGQSKSSAK
jgi:HEAT repeat protein